MKKLSILLTGLFTIQSGQLKEVISFRWAFLFSRPTDSSWWEDRQGEGMVFLVAVKKKADYLCLSFNIRMQILCYSHTKTAASTVTPGDHGGNHPPGTANYGCWKEKVIRRSNLSFAENTTSPLPERHSMWVRGASPIPLSGNQRDRQVLKFLMSFLEVSYILHIALISYDTFLGLARISADVKSQKIIQGNRPKKPWLELWKPTQKRHI